MLTDEMKKLYYAAPRPGDRKRIRNDVWTVITPVVLEESDGIGVVFEIEATCERWLCPLEVWNQTPLLSRGVSTRHWDSKPAQGSQWQHYKGSLYNVVTNAHDVDIGHHYVIYKAVVGGIVWAKTIESWTDTVNRGNNKVQRFVLIA